MSLKLKLQTSNFPQTNITHRSYTQYSSDLSDLPFPRKDTNYMKNVEKGSLGWDANMVYGPQTQVNCLFIV